MNQQLPPHKGCSIDHRRGLPTYFGHEFSVNGYDEEGYRTDWCLVTFPDRTWVKCPTYEQAVKYIDQNIGTHS